MSDRSGALAVAELSAEKEGIDLQGFCRDLNPPHLTEAFKMP